jgi:hypothetical protein
MSLLREAVRLTANPDFSGMRMREFMPNTGRAGSFVKRLPFFLDLGSSIFN